MNFNNLMSNQNEMNIINLQFKAITGVNYILKCKKGVTLSQVFHEYLIRIGKESLFQDNNNKIEFIYNGKTINFKNNNTKIEEFFRNQQNNVEIQIVTNDLIGA